MSRYVFDIETDGLLPICTRMWIIALFDLDTRKMVWFLEGDLGWVGLMDEATLVIGHNIRAFDLPALEKLFGFKLKKETKVHDTLLMSQILNYRRFGHDGHSLEAWGEHLGFPKQVHNDWTQYSEAMRTRCITDVTLNSRVYDVLVDEYQAVAARAPQITHYIRAEHAAAKWMADAELHGWPFKVDEANKIYKLLEAEMQLAYDALSANLGTKTVATDLCKGEVAVKKPKWTKKGFYDVHTAKWFGVDVCSGYEGEERIVEGDYCRVEFVNLSLDSVSDVKIFLFRNGWEPTEWNYKEDPEDPRKKIQTSPKITEDSLEFLGGNGKLYTNFLTAKSRYGVLKTWLEVVDSNDRLHGDCMLVGTPSMRARHQIIVNLPAADTKWGPEIRGLFGCLPGYKIIGCDSSGNQARGLAHYLGDAEYIDILLNGDIHTYNAKKLDAILKEMGVSWTDFLIRSGVKADEKHTQEENIAGKKRAAAKRILYAFLFGASGAKLWSYIFGVLDVQKGNKLKNGFIKAVPGFKALVDKLEKIFSSTSKFGDGYIPSLAGNRIYVDSYHKLLVYLLQAAEKVTCSTALMLTAEGLEAEGIPYIPCIYYHDEIDFMVPEEHAERAAEIGKNAFKEGPKLFGIQIMDGGAKIGDTWYAVH